MFTFICPSQHRPESSLNVSSARDFLSALTCVLVSEEPFGTFVYKGWQKRWVAHIFGLKAFFADAVNNNLSIQKKKVKKQRKNCFSVRPFFLKLVSMITVPSLIKHAPAEWNHFNFNWCVCVIEPLLQSLSSRRQACRYVAPIIWSETS